MIHAKRDGLYTDVEEQSQNSCMRRNHRAEDCERASDARCTTDQSHAGNIMVQLSQFQRSFPYRRWEALFSNTERLQVTECCFPINSYRFVGLPYLDVCCEMCCIILPIPLLHVCIELLSSISSSVRPRACCACQLQNIFPPSILKKR